MFTSYIEACKPSMFQLQCLKHLKNQKDKGAVCNEAEIARALSVNRSTVSRCLKRCVELGILLEDGYELTRKGIEVLTYYLKVEQELFYYFEKIGVEEDARAQAVGGMLDSVDIKTIQMICQREKLHMQYENIGSNSLGQTLETQNETTKMLLPYGTYEVDFSIYREGKNRKKLSMADKGFEKPAILYVRPKGNCLELKIKEVSAYSGSNHNMLLHGHLQTIKCKCRDDGLKELQIQDGRVEIPFDEITLETLPGGRITGQIQLTMTCSVGVLHMPESMATLMLRM